MLYFWFTEKRKAFINECLYMPNICEVHSSISDKSNSFHIQKYAPDFQIQTRTKHKQSIILGFQQNGCALVKHVLLFLIFIFYVIRFNKSLCLIYTDILT